MVAAMAVLAISLGVTISGAYANGDEDPPPQSGKAGPDRPDQGSGANPAAESEDGKPWDPSPREEILPHRENRRLTVRPSSGVDGVGELPGDKGDQDQAPTIPEKTDLKYPNLGSTLDRMVATVEDEGVSGQEAAADSPIQSRGSVAVTIHLNSNVEEVVSFLEDNGGDSRNVGEDYIEGYVPLTLLGQLSEQSGVTSVGEIVPPQPTQIVQRIIGHGPPVHGSALWNQSGYSGQGIKVGIIDVGFKDLSSLIGTELPATIQGRCYTDIGVFTQDLADCEAVGEVTVDIPDCLDDAQRRAVLSADHGTIVAESVIDIAPEVSLYIANPQSRADLQDAADWMASEGVSVINHSVGWLFDGPGNGTSPSTISPLRTVDRAVASDIIWVNAAGNAARDTWFGGYSDPDGDGAIGFGGQNDQVIDMPVRECRSYVVQLRWEDDWGGASTDLDLYLYNKNTGEFVVSSEANQSGESGHVPFEWLRFRAEFDSRDLGIVVDHHGGDAPDWIQLVFWTVDPIQHHTGSGSINNPAESANPGLLAVGAAPWNDVHTIEPYSSRGPTPDGRVKPDLVGVDCGATALMPLNEDYQGFCGTSQAAPHVAGMAALVRQQFPSYTPAQVAAYLKDNAEQREPSDPNNTWGHGFAQLPSSQVSETLKEGERAALVAFYNATGGPSWTKNANWANGQPVGRWHGVTTDPSGRVVGLSLPENGLTGEIPSELRSLANLTWLSLSENEFRGDIPPELGNLSGLTGLWLHENELTGVIPSQLAGITNLTVLSLGRNELTGGIPGELGNLSNMEWMYLGGNQLSGPIPAELGSLANLTVLALGGNQLTGPIPPQLASLVNLKGLYLWGNELTGPIPAELGSLANLTVLALGGNQLTGPIPPQLASLVNLKGLYLWGNELSGTIPAELGSLANLQYLDLDYNQLSGEIPPELGDLANLEEVYLSDNELTGPIPPQLASLVNLKGLYLWGNELSGTIPAELGSLANLQYLDLDYNQLSGEIPPELGDLANLEEVYLSDNELTGPIPPQLASLVNLKGLYLWGNELTGPIPPQLASLVNLKGLYLWGNELTGPIPAELGSLANLTVLALGGNQLTGPIPPQLASLVNLKGLYLWGNELSGTIPAELGSLANLQYLDLDYNQLSGEIPPELGDLANLEEVYLSDNELTGPIPPQLASLVNLKGLYLWGNELTGPIPAELGSLASLEELYLSDNQLSGTIPAELGSLANLQELHLSRNRLTGTIPLELGGLVRLELLFLVGNQLTGCIPAGLLGVANNDFSHLGLLFCDGAGGAPAISAVTPGSGSFTIAWTAPGPDITAYDLRHIESASPDKSDSNWTVAEDVWTTGSGDLNHSVTGLDNGTKYDVQVRAVTADGNGPWSATAAGTPATWRAIRSFSPASVGKGGGVEVTITATGYGASGTVVETLPPWFSYASSSLSDGSVTASGRTVRFALFEETAFSYTVTASHDVGSYTFSGVLTNSAGEEVPVGGAFGVAVEGGLGVHLARSAAALVRIGRPIPVAATFSEPVSGFAIDDIVVTNGIASNFAGEGAAYTFEVTPNAIGKVTVDVAAAAAAADTDGKGNTAARQLSLGIPYDDDQDEAISRREVIGAINDYLFEGVITRAQVIGLINLYLFS